MNAFSKTIIASSIAAATIFSGTAAAATFNPFTVDPVNGSQANFVADKITGNYTETATFNQDGTFNVSLVWTAGQFVGNGGNTAAATLVGKRIAEKAKAAGIEAVAFDRSGFRYHGRVKALADAAREAGLKF